MPSYLLRPDGDIKADWTEDVVGTAFSKLDEVITQPTAPTTGSDRITSATDGQLCTIDFGTTTLAGGETVTGAIAWIYSITPATRNIGITFKDGNGTTIANGTIGTGVTGWTSFTYLGATNQTGVNGLNVQMQAGVGTSTVEVDAVYVELTTRLKSTAPVQPLIPPLPTVA